MEKNKVKNNDGAGIESETVTQEMRQRVIERPNLTFADSTLVMTSKFDVKVYFGISMPREETGEVQYHTILSLSPQLAKALSKSLAKAVADYEKDYMPLKMNDEE